MILQDLNDPSIWRNVQHNRVTALQRFDRVTAVSWDESLAGEGRRRGRRLGDLRGAGNQVR